MFRNLLNITASCALLLSSIAHAGIVIESTRYLYKEGAREITAQIENKDDIPYLIKSWVEAPAGKTPSLWLHLRYSALRVSSRIPCVYFLPETSMPRTTGNPYTILT